MQTKRCTQCLRWLPVVSFDANGIHGHRRDRCSECWASHPGQGWRRGPRTRWETLRVIPGVEMGEQDIANAAGVSRERVRQILRVACAQFVEAWREMGFVGDDLG